MKDGGDTDPDGDDPGRPDAIVVFGCPAASDGSPRPALRTRLEQAAALARALPRALLFLSGRGRRGPCEAEVMRAYLVAHGVAADRIHTEALARNTLENAERVAPLLRTAGVGRVRLVTQRFHMQRAARLLREALLDHEAAFEEVIEVSAGDTLQGISAHVVRILEWIRLKRDLRARRAWRRWHRDALNR